MRFFAAFFAIAGLVRLTSARPADEKMHSGTCRTLPMTYGKNVCAYVSLPVECYSTLLTILSQCDWQSTPLNCNNDSKTGRWNPCVDKTIPNPCLATEVFYNSARNSVDGFKDPLCAKVCPGKRCFTNTMTYKDTCCTCPQGWRPKARGPFCLNGNGIGHTQFCVGCKGAGEKLVWNETRKGWDCVSGK
jgi:hypothetical protein